MNIKIKLNFFSYNKKNFNLELKKLVINCSVQVNCSVPVNSSVQVNCSV